MTASPRPPAHDEVEVSLFGPGVGEALAIHIGDGRWVLVDSCRDRDGTNATLQYLDALGIDPAESVDWVIITHAHDDHVSGLANVVRACSSAQLVFPAASTEVEFLSLLEVDYGLRGYGVGLRVYREFHDVLSTMRTTHRLHDVHYADAGKVLPPGAALSPPVAMRMVALAPSSDAVAQSRRAFAVLADSFRRSGEVRQISRRDPNSYSLGLLLETLGIRVLLGGDVLNGTSSKTGWRYVCSAFAPQRVDIHKVPHHGSMGAFSDGIWQHWLHQNSINIVTTYLPSGIPNAGGIAHMAAFGHKLFATSRTISAAEPRKVKNVRAALSGVSRSVRSSRGLVGHICVRIQPGKAPSVSLASPALQLA